MPVQEEASLMRVESSGTEATPERFDPAAAVSCLDGDEELLRDVAGALLQEWQRRSEHVRRGLAGRDAAAIASAAHALKGAIGQISDGSLTVRLGRIERAAVASDLDTVELLWQSTAPQIDRFIAELLAWAKPV
jgi:HPt (histidine-containing phosphotransfer) domain-containing protein